MRKYLWVLDIVLLLTCAALLLVDLQIKNDLITRAKELEGKLDEQRGSESVDHIHSGIPGDIPDSDVFLDAPVETASSATNGSRPNRARKGNGSAANRGTGNPGQGVSGLSDQVGP